MHVWIEIPWTTDTEAIGMQSQTTGKRNISKESPHIRSLFLDHVLVRRCPRSAFLVLTLGCVIANIFRIFTKIYYSPAPQANHHSTNAREEAASNARPEHHHDSWCLQHQLKSLLVSRVAEQQVQLVHPSTRRCGRLHRRTLWLHGYELRSEVARNIRAQQSNCLAEVATMQLDNDFGLGSHLYQWSQAFCSAEEMGYRLQTHNPQWLWLDQEYCSSSLAQRSPFLCYFPSMESRCGVEEQLNEVNVSSPHNKRTGCLKAKVEEQLPLLRSGSIEFIFSNISSLVVQEAERQVALLFGDNSIPTDLISVHIRYGDKFWEMDLVPIEEYIQAIAKLLSLRGRTWNDTAAHIYLATEDPRAHEEFMAVVPSAWNVYVDRTISELALFRPAKGNRASWTGRNTKGRAGLMTLASLLIALEANDFVLTTKSNWSRLLNDLRTAVLDPRCYNCTNVVDLRPGLW